MDQSFNELGTIPDFTGTIPLPQEYERKTGLYLAPDHYLMGRCDFTGTRGGFGSYQTIQFVATPDQRVVARFPAENVFSNYNNIMEGFLGGGGTEHRCSLPIGNYQVHIY